MNTILGVVLGVTITPWKIVGITGTILFTFRWVVQAIASRRAGKPTLPRLFWYMSIVGSSCLLAYFIFGKNDAVGVLSNAFPLLLACYNLFLDLAHRKNPALSVASEPDEIPSEAV